MADRTRAPGLLARLAAPIRAIRRAIVRDDGQPAPEAEGDTPPDDGLVDDDFLLALQGLLTEGDGAFSTKLQVISLVEFREAVGDKWSRVAEKVLLIAEGVIQRHLGQGNVYGRQGFDAFVLVFRTCGPAEARRRAILIAQDLGTRLLGDQFLGMERPLALAAEIDLADAFKEGALDHVAVNGAVTEMRSLLAQAPQAEAPPRHSPLPGGGDVAVRAGPGPMHSELPAPMPKREPVMVPISAGTRRPAADPNWQAMAGAKRKLAKRPAGPPPVPADVRLALVWRPTWTAEGEAIGAYKARIHRTDREGQPALEGCLAYPVEGGEAAGTAILDRFVVAGAVRGFKAAEAAGDRPTIVVPLHYSSVASAQRQALTAPFADLPEAARANRVAVDLFGLPDDVEARDVAAVIRALRPFCRQVVLRQPLGGARLSMAAQAGADMVGVDLAELAPDERTDDDHLLAALLSLRAAAERNRLPACVWGVRRRKVVIGAVLGGFAMVNGPGLMKDLGRPSKVLPAPRARFGQPG
ncbi:MAG: hypothetical protein ACM31L_13395 [Actinomycetota bacterium]